MGGLGSLFRKIIPIIMLVCFICLGITHTFQQIGQNNITYMSETYYDAETYQIIENPTDEQKETAIKYYNLDVNGYMQGIAGNNTLERAVSNTIDLQTYQDTLNKFNLIWEDGYQFGDGIQTIVNALILVINTILLPINIALVPIRIIAGLLLTGFSIIGIRTTTNTGVIITSLYAILDNLNIPLIPVTTNVDNIERFYNTTWLFNDNLTSNISPLKQEYIYDLDIQVNFTSDGGGNYKAIKWWLDYTAPGITRRQHLAYIDTNNNQVEVYNQNDGWLYQNSKTITISQNNQLTPEDYYKLASFIQVNATQQTTP